jgi:two-component system chemotaxis response regulator CheB
MSGLREPVLEFIQVTCPDCAGVLAEADGTNGLDYQCLIGHRFSGEQLMVDHAHMVEFALAYARRMLAEHALLERKVALKIRNAGFDGVSEVLMREAQAIEAQASRFERGLGRPD